MELFSFANAGAGEFGLRQVATAVIPEPASMAIFGLLGVGAAAGRFRRKK
jgi:hypothetical protein